MDERSLRLSELRNDEWTKVELRSSATLALYQALRDLYAVYAEHGAPRSATTIISLDGDLSAELGQLGGNQLNALLTTLLRRAAASGDARDLLAQIGELEAGTLSDLRNAAGVANLRAALDAWPALASEDERTWQRFLEDHPWILAQAFCQPVVLFRAGATVRPQRMTGREQQIVDFVYTNALTDNLLLVEIKKPTTDLLTRTAYRGTRIYAPSRELVGAVSQISAYRHSVKQYAVSILDATERIALRSDPLSIVVVGDLGQLADDPAKDAFEQYRRELRNIEILTFDELKNRAESMLELLRNGLAPTPADPPERG